MHTPVSESIFSCVFEQIENEYVTRIRELEEKVMKSEQRLVEAEKHELSARSAFEEKKEVKKIYSTPSPAGLPDINLLDTSVIREAHQFNENRSPFNVLKQSETLLRGVETAGIQASEKLLNPLTKLRQPLTETGANSKDYRRGIRAEGSNESRKRPKVSFQAPLLCSCSDESLRAS